MIAPHYPRDFITIAVSMFARGSPENFFRYMRQHYNIDALAVYSLAVIPDTTRVVNGTQTGVASMANSIADSLNLVP
ncbi:MAG: hypothetical protein O7D86_11260 [Proteobacteria bacterium]|nr:hypothetical protein [Pseudomonadota bacterium]